MAFEGALGAGKNLDAKEVQADRFADSPLAKKVEGTEPAMTVEECDKPFGGDLKDENACELNCPSENGTWKGERGNGKWCPDGGYIPMKSNPDNKSWKDILEHHGIDGISFKDGEPDFGEVSKGEVKIDEFSRYRPDNFSKAEIELANQKGCSPQEVKNWRKENGYTWHECRDMETMQKVPAEVHNNISHRGGISEVKKEA